MPYGVGSYGDSSYGVSSPGPGAATWQTIREFDDVSVGEQRLIGRWDGTDNQFQVVRNGADIRVYIADAGNDSSNFVDFTVGIVAGDIYDLAVTYDGGTVALYTKKYDPATGTYGTQSSPTATVTGTIPTTLRASALGYDLIATGFDGKVDEDRINEGIALSAATLDGETIYSRTDVNWTHAYPYDGNANDVIGTLDGTVSGATQVADGRQPTSWNEAGSGETDRATGSANLNAGTYGARLKGLGVTTRRRQTGITVVDDSLLYLRGHGRRGSTGIGQIEILNSGNSVDASVTFDNVASITQKTVSFRANETTKGVAIAAGDGVDVWSDDVELYELSTVSASTATKEIPSRVIWSLSKDGSTHPHVYIALTGSETIEVGIRNASGAIFEAGKDTTLSTGLHTIGLAFDGTNLKAIVDGSEEATTGTPTENINGVDIMTFGAIRANLDGHFFDNGVGKTMIFSGRVLSTSERKTNHNWLRHTDYNALPQA